jgi:hypothetical protein
MTPLADVTEVSHVSDVSYFSLRGTIDHAASRLPPALVSPAALGAVRRIAAAFPAAMTSWIDFECRLQDDAPQVDLSFRIDRRARHLLAGYSEAREASSSVCSGAAWGRVAAFAREWADAAAPVHRNVAAVWLEFDLEPAADSATASPRVFIDLDGPARAAPDRLGRALGALGAITSVLAPFIGRPAPAWLAEGLGRALRELPPGAELLYVGLPAGERVSTIRLCVRGPNEHRGAAGYADYLGAIGWPGLAGSGLFRERDTRAAILHFDLDDRGSVGTRLGFEYPFRRRPQVKGIVVDTTFLDDLVTSRACTPGKRDALLAWPGCEIGVLPHEVWPSLVMRRVSHVKIVADRDRPIEAKAYCCFAHAWRTALADRRPPLSGPFPMAS